MKLNKLAVMAFGALLSTTAMAQFNETEPNDNKAQANFFGGLTTGFTITGTSTGSSTITPGLASSDNFRLQMASGALGIYRHRLTITSNVVGHTGSIRGLNQTGTVGVGGTAGTVDTTIQSSSATTTPPRFNQWYGFGKGEELYYRVAGAAATTASYTVTHSVDVVTPLIVGSYNPGSITINTVGATGTSQTDTDLWVYDSNFNAIPGYGNDDHFGGATLGSTLTRNYAAGTYYIAISNFQMANNMVAAADDDFVTGALMDFPNIVANSSTTANLNVGFTINDGSGPLAWSATKVGPYDVVFAKFTVVPEPGTMIAVSAGIGALALRRRRRIK